MKTLMATLLMAAVITASGQTNLTPEQIEARKAEMKARMEEMNEKMHAATALALSNQQAAAARKVSGFGGPKVPSPAPEKPIVIMLDTNALLANPGTLVMDRNVLAGDYVDQIEEATLEKNFERVKRLTRARDAWLAAYDAIEKQAATNTANLSARQAEMFEAAKRFWADTNVVHNSREKAARDGVPYQPGGARLAPGLNK